eukprot:7043088-Prymnesium_polylepis.1
MGRITALRTGRIRIEHTSTGERSGVGGKSEGERSEEPGMQTAKGPNRTGQTLLRSVLPTESHGPGLCVREMRDAVCWAEQTEH